MHFSNARALSRTTTEAGTLECPERNEKQTGQTRKTGQNEQSEQELIELTKCS